MIGVVDFGRVTLAATSFVSGHACSGTTFSGTLPQAHLADEYYRFVI